MLKDNAAMEEPLHSRIKPVFPICVSLKIKLCTTNHLHLRASIKSRDSADRVSGLFCGSKFEFNRLDAKNAIYDVQSVCSIKA